MSARNGARGLHLEPLQRVDVALARELIDFDPRSRVPGLESGFGHSQLEGCVQAFNQLATNRVAYLADEVGLGKTYVALGVVALLRHLRPDVRVMFVAPRENIQRKWIKEQQNFVRNNWCVPDNRVKSIQGTPARRPLFVPSLDAWVHELVIGDRRDLFMRMTSFSPSFKKLEDRHRFRLWLRRELPWIPKSALSGKTPEAFRDEAGRVLNAAVPPIDLLVVDEAHNLKHGFTERGSTRNRLMALAFGHPAGASPEAPWYGPRVARVLLLSATPFESDISALHRQLDLFGLGDIVLRDAEGRSTEHVSALADPELGDEGARAVARNFLVRRVGTLRAGNEQLTKNLYRREWRHGGFEAPDKPMRITDPRERLVIGLVQKKVAEVLGDERFNNHFQIGMLSSFESFLETVARKKRRAETEEEGTDDTPEFDDAEQTRDTAERRGVDTRVLEGLVQGYRDRFGTGLPHPKLDATTEALEGAFQTGEKALVFVRRVATAGELASKLARRFDACLLERLRSGLPAMRAEIDLQFERYLAESRSEEPRDTYLGADVDATALDEEPRELLDRLGESEGGSDDFFSWFFRGEGPSGVLSGAAFQRNRLANASSAYSTLFEDDYVARLLERPADVMHALAMALGLPREEVARQLSRLAWAHYDKTWRRASTGYPRTYLFEAYQAAALWLLQERGSAQADRAKVILHERFPDFRGEEGDPPETLPGPEGFLGIDTFFTELVRRPVLRAALWPEEQRNDWLETFRRSEQRRELLSAMARLGAAYVDLWMLAVEPLGTLELGRAGERGERPDRALAIAFADLLERQAKEPGFHAYRELAGAAEAFDTVLAVNFPEVATGSITELPRTYARTLQNQMPVAAMSGAVNHRVVRQFRMPGYPQILVTTDVLQEGEDLHTFCRRVAHYGIAWTPSAMEQRTGRVDRIGSLVQRRNDGASELPADTEKIQVYYPHLPGTIEVLQVRRVLRRLDRFLELVHVGLFNEESAESSIDAAREILSNLPMPEPPRIPLESAFPVREAWLRGELGPDAARPLDVAGLEQHFGTIWEGLVEALGIVTPRRHRRFAATGELRIRDGCLVAADDRNTTGLRRQGFQVELISRAARDTTLVRCTSHVGLLDLRDDAVLDRLYELQRKLDHPRICVRPDRQKRYRVAVQRSLLFHPHTTQAEEVQDLVLDTTLRADRVEELLLGVDQEQGTLTEDTDG